MRDRTIVRLLLSVVLLLGVGLPARAITLTKVSADWPEGVCDPSCSNAGADCFVNATCKGCAVEGGICNNPLLRFPPFFVEPQVVFVVSGGAGTQLIWRGPDHGEGVDPKLVYRPPSLPLDIPIDENGASEPFVVGTFQYANFPTTTKGPLFVSLELTFTFSELNGFTRTVLLPFEMNHTPDDVLEDAIPPSACLEGSATVCDDLVLVEGDAPVEGIPDTGGSDFEVTLLGFDGAPFDASDNTIVTNFMALEDLTGPRVDLYVQITNVPEPATIPVLGLALAAIWMGQRRARRRANPRPDAGGS
jgi:hypothetical protein